MFIPYGTNKKRKEIHKIALSLTEHLEENNSLLFSIVSYKVNLKSAYVKPFIFLVQRKKTFKGENSLLYFISCQVNLTSTDASSLIILVSKA